VIAALQCALPLARMELLDATTVRAVNAYSRLTLPEMPLLLVEMHGSPSGVAENAQAFCEIVRQFGATAMDEARTTEERGRLWQARHDVFWAVCAMRPGAKGISTDVCVPVSRLAECMAAAENKVAETGLIAPIAGHVGDGNFHHLILVDPEDQAERGMIWLFPLKAHVRASMASVRARGAILCARLAPPCLSWPR